MLCRYLFLYILMELSVQYKQMFGKDMNIDKLLVLN